MTDVNTGDVLIFHVIIRGDANISVVCWSLWGVSAAFLAILHEKLQIQHFQMTNFDNDSDLWWNQEASGYNVLLFFTHLQK